MITFYVNGHDNNFIDHNIRYCRKKYINKLLTTYGIDSKVVIFNKDNVLNKEFLIDILRKQAEGYGLAAITRRGMLDKNSSNLSRLAKYNKKAIRDWKLMLIDKETPLTTNKAIDWLLDHPIFINSLIMYDDEMDIYYTNQISLGCEMARNRKVKAIRRKLNYDNILQLEARASLEKQYETEDKHSDYWAEQEREFETDEIEV